LADAPFLAALVKFAQARNLTLRTGA
jgi:hypothetical protein